MLDSRSKIVLKYLVKQCENSSYKVIEIADIISAMPKKFSPDYETVAQVIKHLSGGDYISVKYSDDTVYCLSPMPFGRQFIEAEEEQKKNRNKNKSLSVLTYVLIFITALIAAFLGTLINNLIY